MRHAITAWILLSAAAADAQRPAVRYDVRLAAAGDSLVHVALQLATPRGAPTDIGIPRAIPMGYGTQPYDRFVEGFVARAADGSTIAADDIEGPRWRVAASPSAPLSRVEYRVNLARMEREVLNAGDASRVRPRYLGLLGYSMLAFVAGLEDAPVAFTLHVPAGWPVVTTLDPAREATDSLQGQARDFLALADAQFLAGPDLVVRRIASAVPLAFTLYAEDATDAAPLAELSDRALRAAADYFGVPAAPHFTSSFEVLRPLSPTHIYSFSMEHLEGATFRFAVGNPIVAEAGRSRQFYNILHHVAHSWIPKRCAPAGYYPFTWDYAEPIDMIWFSEGWAQYAAADMAAGTGPDAAQSRRARGVVRFDAAAADTLPPLDGRSTAELSRTASHEYSDDFRIAQAVFSRGARMAEEIDNRVRARTGGTRTFRDIARGLMAWCGTASRPIGVDDVARIARASTGVPVRDIMDRWLAPRGARPAGRPRP